MRCHHHGLELELEEFWGHILNDHLYRLEQLVTEMNDDQKRLDADVVALQAAIKTEVDYLKAQAANNPTAPASSLDFTGLENLITSVQASVPPAAPTLIAADDPQLASAPPTPSTVGAVNPSPFVDTDGDGEAEPDGDADDAPAAPDQVPAQSSEATSAPATDAASVTDPGNQVTPSTENPPAAPAE